MMVTMSHTEMRLYVLLCAIYESMGFGVNIMSQKCFNLIHVVTVVIRKEIIM